MKRIVSPIVGFLVRAAPAAADLSSGIAAYRLGDYATAAQEILPLAERGGATAQYYAGALYEAGLGIEQSYDQAVKWYRKAAAQGSVKAQFHLGLLHEIGEGVGKDHARAVEWYLRAAEQGYAPAQSNLGSLYLRGGWGIESNPFQAHVWLGLAEAQSFPGAKRKRMYAERFLTREQISDAEDVARDRKRTER